MVQLSWYACDVPVLTATGKGNSRLPPRPKMNSRALGSLRMSVIQKAVRFETVRVAGAAASGAQTRVSVPHLPVAEAETVRVAGAPASGLFVICALPHVAQTLLSVLSGAAARIMLGETATPPRANVAYAVTSCSSVTSASPRVRPSP